MKIVRLSDRVIVLTGLLLPAGGYVTAVNTEKGIAVIDTGACLGATELFRNTIQKEFPGKDFAYVIHTHGHGDHVGANQIFPEAEIVAHKNSLPYFTSFVKPDQRDNIITYCRKRAASLRQRMEKMDKDSEDFKYAECRLALLEQIILDGKKNNNIRFPTITFNKKMSLDMGDLTINMYAFLNYHSDADILIHIPEEGILLIGDTFSRSSLPGLNSTAAAVDVTSWIRVLDRVLEEGKGVRHAVRGHSYILTHEEIKARRDYIYQIWTAVKKANAEDLSPEQIFPRLPLKDFEYITGMYERDLEELKNQHERIITGFWRQLQGRKFATEILARILRAEGMDETVKKFRTIVSEKEKYFFNENIVNIYAGMMVQEGAIKNALELYRLNAIVFPESADIYSGMGDAHLANNDNEAALKAYQRALELDPENNEIKKKLERVKSSK
jgi:glyoxylase-like metal-dependent hydrolase (beta-lactamase superfamily II)